MQFAGLHWAKPKWWSGRMGGRGEWMVVFGSEVAADAWVLLLGSKSYPLNSAWLLTKALAACKAGLPNVVQPVLQWVPVPAILQPPGE